MPNHNYTNEQIIAVGATWGEEKIYQRMDAIEQFNKEHDADMVVDPYLTRYLTKSEVIDNFYLFKKFNYRLNRMSPNHHVVVWEPLPDGVYWKRTEYAAR